jgi:hypothetical protein
MRYFKNILALDDIFFCLFLEFISEKGMVLQYLSNMHVLECFLSDML